MSGFSRASKQGMVGGLAKMGDRDWGVRTGEGCIRETIQTGPQKPTGGLRARLYNGTEILLPELSF